MAKNHISQQDTDPANNTDLGGINIAQNAMLMSSINDAFREQSAQNADFYDDLGGTGTVGGTADAITLTSAMPALATGNIINFFAGADNTGAATINVNGLGAKAIRKISSGSDVALAAGDLLNGKFHHLVYDAAANSAAGAWILDNPATDTYGLVNVVEDTTPQLGGDLDLNSNGITFPGATVTDVTGADTLLVSGTAGTDGNLAQWNSDGDLVDGSKAAADLVTGPASSTDNTIPRFDSTTGKVIQTSGITVDDSDNMTGVGNLGLSTINGWTPREVLTANRTYYVDTSGSDSNDGLSSGAGAFATLQKAWDVISSLDLSIYSVTVQVADGSYSGFTIDKAPVGGTRVTFEGNTSTPTNVVLSGTNTIVATAPSAIPVRFQYLQMGSSAGDTIRLTAPCQVEIGTNVVFGSTQWSHMSVLAPGAFIKRVGNYTIAGGGQRHLSTEGAGAKIENGGTATITLTGTPAFSVAYAHARWGSMISDYNKTFVGSATGVRYSAVANAVIFTNGGGASYFPGDSAGSTSTGGQYV